MENLEREYFSLIYYSFPTHVPVTANKKAPDKYQKITGQNLYSGAMNRFQRGNAVEWLHNYLLKEIPQTHWDWLKSEFVNVVYPIQLQLIFYAPLNYGTVKRIKGNIVWHPAQPDYIPNWDIDNQWIWNKLFCDVLQMVGLIPNDTVNYISSFQITFVETPDLINRKLVFKLYTLINC